MAIPNDSVIRRLDIMFRINEGIPSNYIPNRNVNYSRNNVFNVSLRVTDMVTGAVEFPVAAGSYAVFKSDTLHDFIVPLSAPRATYFKRTTASVFTTLMSARFDMSSRICRVDTFKGNTYYGGLGMILDKDKDPIMLTTFSKLPGTDIISRPAIRLRPDVVYSDGEIERYVIKTIVPYILENGVCCPAMGSNVEYNIGKYTDRRNRIIPDIIISDDIRHFVIVPKVPHSFSDDDINDMLQARIDEVCDNILL